MPRYDNQVLNYASTWMTEMAYGYASGENITSPRRAILNHLMSFDSADTDYVVGNSDTPTARTLARLAFATAIREAMVDISERSTLYIWASLPGETPIEIDTSRGAQFGVATFEDPSGTGQVSVTVAWSPRASQRITAHWSAAFSRVRGFANATTAARLEAALAATGDIPEGIVFEAAPRGSAYAGTIRPTDELLAALPEKARQFANLTIPSQASGGDHRSIWIADDENHVTLGRLPAASSTPAITINGATLVRQARESYRIWIRMRWNRNNVDEREAEQRRQREAHRIKSAANFNTFRSKQMIEERLVPTLPFLPHGLASSRRWGIEIESGGARGVSAPAGWRRKTDSSIRSAWDGYEERQDFEPYDETVTDTVSWFECANYDNHMPHEEYFDDVRQEYVFRVRESYIPVADCTECGTRTRVVRREPQTIRHTRGADDCGEFVSPILVSMHSNGLQSLLAEVSQQPQNDSAGVHVHVEATDLNDKQIATLIYGYDLLEHMLESSYQRGSTRNYCKRRPADNVLNAARALKDGGTNMGDVRGSDRYVTTNTQSLNNHGTIEFRAMGAVYDYEYLIRWAMFCREMVNIAKAGVTQKEFGRVKKWEDVLVLFAKYGKEYVRAAVYEMTGEAGSQKRLSKSGSYITTEAANDDLRTVVEQLSTRQEDSSETFRRLSRTVAPVLAGVTDLDTIASRLAVSDLLLQTV